MPIVTDSARRFIGAAAAAAGALALTAGCARTPRAVPQSATPTAAESTPDAALPASLAALASKARQEAVRPRAHTPAQTPGNPLPPGLAESSAERLRPGADTDPVRTRMGLDEAVAELAAAEPGASPRPREAEPAEAEAALRLYLSGREKLLTGNAAGAVVDLKKAAELDPESGEPWRELGEAQLATGSRIESIASFEQAAKRGPEDARVLELLSRAALERGDVRRAAALLARASLAAPERVDPFLPVVVDLAMARTMAQAGYTTAGRDAMLRAAARSSRLSTSTRYGEEYSAIMRRQGDLWREIGDGSCRLGQYDRAIDAYARAQGLPSLDDDAIAPRLIYACMQAGRPYAAALGVVRRIAAQSGRVSPADNKSLRYLSEHTATGPEIAAALRALAHELPQPVPPTVERGLVRARSAVTPRHEARGVLRGYATSHPIDPAFADALIDSAPDAAAAVTDACRILSAQPLTAGRLAEALLRSDFETASLDAALAAESGSQAGALLEAYYQALRGSAATAAAEAAAIRARGPLDAAVELARVEIGVAAARTELAVGGLEALQSMAAPARSFALARALAWFQKNDAALAELEPTLTAGSNDLDALLLGGELAISVGRGDDAERWLTRAREIDPFDDRAYSRMLVLYGAGGIEADSTKLNQTVRELRESVPDSRTLRGARTKELVRRSLLTQAETEALALAAEDPSDIGAVDLLVSIWRARAEREGPAKLAEGRAWLEAQLTRRPAAPALMAGLVTIMVAQGQVGEAAERLKVGIEAGGQPDLSRMREKLLRDDLGRPEEANSLALARLQDRPRTITESLELADVLARAGDDVKAANTILAAATADITVAPEQATRILVLTGQMAQRAVEEPDNRRRAAVAQLFDLLVARNVKFSPDMHQRRLVVLAFWPEADAERLLSAAAFTASQYPNLGAAPYARTSQALAAANRGLVAQVFIAKAVERVPEPSLDYFIEWFRVTAFVGTPGHARDLIARAQSSGKLRELVLRVSGQTEAELRDRDLRAEAAYFLGNIYAANDRTDQANGAYELALEYDPGHPWACNNLGYALLEAGGDLERAGRLLERAHEALPEETAITDSLGWFRYKQGVLDDERAPDGTISRRGAISLLQAAAMTDRGQSDPTILDHLGDALWLAGRADEARRYWELTERAATRDLASSERPGPATPRGADDPATEREQAAAAASSAALKELRTLKGGARVKILAAEAGQAVRVAPQVGNADPKPMVTPPAQSPPVPAPEEAAVKDVEPQAPVLKRID